MRMRSHGALALLVLAGCSHEANVSKRNDAPLATILTPSTGSEVVEGDTVSFEGIVTDAADGDALVATWFAAGRLLCPPTPVASDGATSCEAVVGRDDAVILLEGRDPDNAVGVATVELVIRPGGAPEVEILTPDGAGPYYADRDIAFAAVVGDAEDDPTALSARWEDAAGAPLDIDATPDADGALAGAYRFAPGPHAVTLTVTDTTGRTASTTVAFQVGVNSRPGAPGLAITPTAPFAGADDLLCGIVTESVDVDGDPVDYTIEWAVDGAAYPGAFSGATGPTTTTRSGDTIPAADTGFGTTWVRSRRSPPTT